MANDDENFDLEAYKKALEEEFQSNGNHASEAKTMLENHAPRAAMAIMALMEHAFDARVRLNAAKYILDNTVFSVPKDEEELKDFLKDLKS
jgi:hypothetical protein